MPASAPQTETDEQALEQAGADGHRWTRHFHDGDLIAAIHDLRDVDFLEIIRQAIVKGFQPIDFALDAIELREPLAQIERFGFPFLDVALQVLHLFADGFAAGLEFLDGVLPVKLDQVFLLGDFIVQLDDLRMLGPQVLGEGVALRP